MNGERLGFASTAECLWGRVDKGESCWMWVGPLNAYGYGSMTVDGRSVGSHRMAWALTRGPIPSGQCVLHNCDVNYPPGDITYRRCVNPAHLFVGSRRDNALWRDRVGRTASGDRNGTRTHPERNAALLYPERLARGARNGAYTHPEKRPRAERNGARTKPETRARGTHNGWARINDEIVREVRRRISTGERQRDIGAALGLHQTHISRIARRQLWAHVE